MTLKNELIAQPYAHWIADILHRFEDGKPLSSDQLNFLLTHEKSLGSHALDLVIKYYLSAHKNNPDKSLEFTIPSEKLDQFNFHQLKEVVHNLLEHNLSHVDLNMSLEQFKQFKVAGLHEIIYWHGPQFLTRALPSHNMLPRVIYLQLGQYFGVVTIKAVVERLVFSGNVNIYFEYINDRSLNQCILDYAKKHALEEKLRLEHSLTHPTHEELIDQPLHRLPSPKYGIYHADLDENK